MGKCFFEAVLTVKNISDINLEASDTPRIFQLSEDFPARSED